MSELAKALCEYQRQTGGFAADKKSTHRNVPAYASIGAVINNVKKANAFGLTFTQEVDFEEDTMFVRTVLMHISGEARISRYPIYVDDKTNSQKIGGAITYAKRYALASMFGTEKGVEDTDDDGESNGFADDAPKTVSSQPAATAPDQVSLSGDAGHYPGGGLQPTAGAFSDPAIVAAAPDDRVEETLAKVTDVKVLEAAFRQRGGTKQPDNIVKMFGQRKKELMNV